MIVTHTQAVDISPAFLKAELVFFLLSLATNLLHSACILQPPPHLFALVFLTLHCLPCQRGKYRKIEQVEGGDAFSHQYEYPCSLKAQLDTAMMTDDVLPEQQDFTD